MRPLAIAFVLVLGGLKIPAQARDEAAYELFFYDLEVGDEWESNSPGVARVHCEFPCVEIKISCRLEGPLDSSIRREYYLEGLKLGIYLYKDQEGQEPVADPTVTDGHWPLVGSSDIPRECETPGGSREGAIYHFQRNYVDFWGEDLEEVRFIGVGPWRGLLLPPKPDGGSYKIPTSYPSPLVPFHLFIPSVPALSLPFLLLGSLGMGVMALVRYMKR
jgi:hypothetical protein